jgi:hypothetical protein
VNARWIGTDIGESDKLTQVGDIAIGAANYHAHFMVLCPCCERLHVVRINDEGGSGPSWSWNQETLTLSPSVRVTYPTLKGEGPTCHWTLTNGVFNIHPDSSAGYES